MDPIAEQLVARLRRDPNDLAAYDELKTHYRKTNDYASLANLLEGWAGANQEDWQHAADAYAEAADAVFATHDAERASALYRMALQMNALHPEAGVRLIELLEQHGDPTQLAEFLDAYARTLHSAGGSSEYVSSLFERLAQLWEHSFARPEVAAEYRALASGVGAAQPAQVDHGDAQERAAELEQRANAEADPAQRAALLVELADLRGQLEDVAGAIQSLRQALSAMPGDTAIMHRLATYLLTRAAQADELTARADHRRVAELFYQIAQGVDQEQALEYLESALASMPEHEGALGMLERQAAQLERTDILPRHWVAYVGAAAEGPDLDQRRLRLGEAYLQAGQLDDALFCLQPAAAHGNDRANELLQSLYAQQAAASGDAAPPQAGANDEGAASLPASGRPQRRSSREHIVDEAAIKIAELRRLAHEALTARRHDEAAGFCRDILALDPLDAEAFNLLDSHYRKRRDYPALRELLLSSTRVPGLTVDARKLRLREVATLSETKLRDSDAAMSAWRSVVALDPADREASASLKRLIKKAQLWDELAGVLEREALATTALEEKAALLREIALLHRDKRKDRAETAAAFRQLYALKPDDSAVRDELCELHVELEQWSDAAALLRDRIDASADAIDVQKLSVRLATILHEQLADLDGAFELCERMLQQRPNDRPTFERMERIDEQSGNSDRLLATLGRRAALAPKAEKPALFMRMGKVAEEKAHDIERAAECYGDALDLAPDNPEAMQHLVEMFERTGHYDQLVDTLRERALMEKDTKNRAPLFRRIARTLAEKVSDEQGAAEAYRSLLAIEEDEEALRFLREIAARDDQPVELADVLRRLILLVQDVHERSTLTLDLAFVLHERIERSAEAASALKRLLAAGGPVPHEAVELLLEISELAGDDAGMALALEHGIAQNDDPEARRAAARRLADLCEGPLADRERAIKALRLWIADDQRNPEPQRRLRALLQATEQWSELLPVLDALTEWEDDFDARDEAALAGGKLAFERLNDAQGAWQRLRPLMEQHSADAERELRVIAKQAELHAPLAALYVELAQQTDDPAVQARYWGSAAEVYENELGDDAQALEASLRRLAADLGNRTHLDAVDRLATRAKAYRRLGAVYDRLLKETRDDGEKVDLLRRHAVLLEREHPNDALDRVLRACALAPSDEALLERAEDLAERTQRSEELLVVYDRRRARSDDDADRVHLLLRAALLCDGALRDRERANQYLKLAIAAAADADALAAQVEAAALELDSARPELGADAARRALVRSQREVAERADPAVAVRLLLRAADLMRKQLDDERGAFDLLRQGVALQPTSDEVFAALLELADRLKRLDAVDAHLARLIDETIEPAATVVLLRRRGALLEGPLNRFQDAAAVYTKLLQLRPDDADATSKLLASLRRSGRHQDLLLVLNKQLQRTRDRDKRIELLRQIATSWERDIKNRWEAIDAWKAVTREAADDETALAALDRLGKSRTAAPDSPAASSSDAPAAEAPAAQDADPQTSPSLPLFAGSSERDGDQPEPRPDPTGLGLDGMPLATPGAAEATPIDQPAFTSFGDERADGLDIAAPAPVTDATPSMQLETAATAQWLKPDLATGNGIVARNDEPAPETPADAPLDDLDALDATLRQNTREEVDVLDGGAVEHVDIDVMFEDNAGRSRPVPPRLPSVQAFASGARSSSAPPAPPGMRGSAPPPPPPARVSLPLPTPSAAAPFSPLPGQRSLPPPLPSMRGSAPPPAPPAAARASVPQSASLPLPPPSVARSSSVPPPPPSASPSLPGLPRPPIIRPPSATSAAQRGASKPPPLPSKRPSGASQGATQPPPPPRKEQ